MLTNWNDVVDVIDVTFDHNQPTLIIIMSSTLNEKADNESWGIRDFELSIVKCPAGCSVCNK